MDQIANPPPPTVSDALYQQALASHIHPTLLVHPQSDRIMFANQAAANLLGRSISDLKSTAMSSLHKGQVPSLVVFSQAALYHGFAWTRGLNLMHADGTEIRLEHEARALHWEGADYLIIILCDLDARHRRDVDAEADNYLREGIAEWRRAERFFREIERENQLILGAAGEGIYGVNSDGVTTFVNPAAERMLGWTAEELVGKEIHSIIHHSHVNGDPYHAEHCPIYNAFREGIVRRVDDEVFWRSDGKPIRVEYTSTPIRDHGLVIGAVIVFRDITERKIAEEKLHAALAEVDRLRERLELENAYLQEEILSTNNHHEIIGQSEAINSALKQIDLVAPTDANVLITGESGTGKELIARAIHQASHRRDRVLVRVNCAAIPHELFESEFFGHVRGAFTGAVRDRVGRFELADGGTLFLDEVGEIPLELQGKLLRVLQDQKFERIGEERTREVNVRLLAATNRDLKEEVRLGRFREDLYFRLNVFPIECRPLRERPDDIPPLATHFLRNICQRLNIPQLTLTNGQVRSLMKYDWPGNARELENIIERAAILARDGKLNFDLPEPNRRETDPGNADPARDQINHASAILTEDDRRKREYDNIIRALETTRGRIFGPDGAAALLNVKPTTLASRIKKLRIDRRDFTPSGQH
ncbi:MULTISPECIES: sigma 54-interacting transcriptional regulator [Thalassospira]|jgi:PAS domain S-box-containing protein|nr:MULTISPECIES: sigma 54-interacting transcriptional regulator [Thalassospira]MAB32812.1 histidine kinase [Thalassospira sp.]MBA05991.1 histidine kinase [Thalassospira sp.]MCD1592971.1 sigma 54-interacting transcriptional regulator [Thalassospira xiamenensis]MDM7974748.1 sigma 54-interacting transcriptional regulator [Thalassospira xiamenensis]OCK06336.1 putative PAS/PAC sensor protein [Thalassospira sp. KO164]|tara:strand:+ start:925 stop:2868 length:1944 start_codon:yes stop_codon:yes gene_type:complete